MKRILYVALIGSVFVTGAQAQPPQNSSTYNQNCSQLRSLAKLPYETWCIEMTNRGRYSDYLECTQSQTSADEWFSWRDRVAKDLEDCQKPPATTTR